MAAPTLPTNQGAVIDSDRSTFPLLCELGGQEMCFLTCFRSPLYAGYSSVIFMGSQTTRLHTTPPRFRLSLSSYGQPGACLMASLKPALVLKVPAWR